MSMTIDCREKHIQSEIGYTVNVFCVLAVNQNILMDGFGKTVSITIL